jgi:hypothetical protein
MTAEVKGIGMRRSIVLLATLAFVTAATAAGAAERTVESRYENPAAGSADAGGGCVAGADGCESMPSGPGEILMSVEIIDDAGGKVSASASWDTDGDGISDTGFNICGKTDDFQSIPQSTDITIFVYASPSSSCPDAVATAGVVKATFSTGSTTGGGGGGGGSTALGSPRAGLGIKDTTPKKGATTQATATLKVCGDHAGTKIQLQKQSGKTWKKVAQKKLNAKCRVVFQLVADFKKATFRSFWPKQDDDHRAGKSKPVTVTTH